MTEEKKVLCVIPARGGSKGIPGKNIKLLGGKPLIAYPIELAKNVNGIDRVIVSTDSEEIADIAKAFGAEVPFIRPAQLAEDKTPTQPVLKHAVQELEKKGYKPDFVLLLYATNPLLKKEDVERAIKVAVKKGSGSVVSVEKDSGRFWKQEKQFYPEGRENRQFFEPLLRENGAIYLSDYETIVEKDKVIDDKNCELLEMEQGSVVDIDSPEDWEEVEKRIEGKSKSIKIGNKEIGDGRPCFIIAEAGSNFRISENAEKNFQRALKLVDVAAEAGADAVKFQLYKAKNLYVDGAGKADYLRKEKEINEIIEEMELPVEWLPKLKKHCDEKGIMFLCTPFDEKAVDGLEKIGIEGYKIASYAISHIPLLEHVASKGKPVIFSLGASNHADIDAAVMALGKAGCKEMAMMQCTAKYPAPLASINLRTIPELKKKYGVPVGLSDHSKEHLVAPLGAVARGANIIEKHFTTGNDLPGPDHKFAVLPEELKEMIFAIRNLEKAMGSPHKEVLEEERELFDFCRRSIYTVKDIKEGGEFSAENVAVLRPGKKERGLEPKQLAEILGKKAKRSIKKGEPIRENDF